MSCSTAFGVACCFGTGLWSESSLGALARLLRCLTGEVFPSEQRMDLWRLLLKGPAGTPYEGGIFCLWLLFPAEYPIEAPECRFQTSIYHCNINSSGKARRLSTVESEGKSRSHLFSTPSQ